MAVVARLYRDHRGAARHGVALEATLRDNDRRPHDVVVEQLSKTGFLIPAMAQLAPGEQVTIGIPGIGMCHARVVREAEAGFGCEFLHPLSEDELAEAMVTKPAEPIPLSLFRFSSIEAPGAGLIDDRWPWRVRVWSLIGLAVVFWWLTIAAARFAWLAIT